MDVGYMQTRPSYACFKSYQSQSGFIICQTLKFWSYNTHLKIEFKFFFFHNEKGKSKFADKTISWTQQGH